jgi:hypothetical protein
MTLLLSGSNGITFPDTKGPFDGADLAALAMVTTGTESSQGQGTTNFYNAGARSTTEAHVIMRAARTGTIQNLYCHTNTNVGGSGQTAVFMVLIDGSDTSVTATISTGAQEAADTSSTASVTAGDQITVRVVTSGSAGTLFPHASFEIQAS